MCANKSQKSLKVVLLPAMILLGIVVAYLLVSNAKKVTHSGAVMSPRAVEFETVNVSSFRAKATAYGNVEPSITLLSKAEVSGKVSYVHPDLKQGQSIAAGEVVIRIDPSDYQVSLKQTEADLQANQQTLVQLEEEEKTTQRSMALASENLRVQQQEFTRINDLWKRKLVSRSTLDAAKQKLISSQQQAEDLQGKLNSFGSRKDSGKANIARTEQQVKGQRTNLGRTEITMPFDARIGEVSIENNEFVSVGSALFVALDIKGVEISGQLPVTEMSKLTSHLDGMSFNDLQLLDLKDMVDRLNLTAQVNLVGSHEEAFWAAKVLRLGESVDTTRRTISLVVGVDDPYKKIIPGRRPPLLKGMYTAIEFSGPEQQGVVIPRSAVHEGRVYLVAEDNTLEIRDVDIHLYQNELAIVRSGLKPGERLIVTDLFPLIQGMPLTPVVRQLRGEALTQKAEGQGGE